MGHRLFVSHAAADKSLADWFVDLVAVGGCVEPNTIFCSSLEGLGIPPGSNFVNLIRETLADTEVVVALLTPNYLSSQFCLCELGATWVLGHELVPVVVPPVQFSDLEGVLTGVQASRITEGDDLTDIVTSIAKELGTEVKYARWEAKRNQYLERLPDLLGALPVPQTVERSKHEELREHYVEARDELERAFKELEAKEALIEELKAAKDPAEVHAIEEKHLSDVDAYEAALSEAKKSLRDLPGIVVYALFRDIGGDGYFVMNEWEESERLKEARRAAEEDFLKLDGNEAELNLDDPKVASADKSIRSFGSLLDRLSPEFHSWFEREHGLRAVISNKRAWKLWFGHNSSMY